MAIIIPEIFKSIVERVNEVLSTRDNDPFPVFYDFGHYAEVVKNLTTKDGSISNKNRKYPLVWLVMDFVEQYNTLSDGYCVLPDLQILITTVTTPDITTAQRIEKTFKPRLYPIYSELLEQISASGYFQVMSPDSIPHEKIDRPYWGLTAGVGGYNNTANLFNDFIDAIQIRKLRLTVNEEVCEDFKM